MSPYSDKKLNKWEGKALPYNGLPSSKCRSSEGKRMSPIFKYYPNNCFSQELSINDKISGKNIMRNRIFTYLNRIFTQVPYKNTC